MTPGHLDDEVMAAITAHAGDQRVVIALGVMFSCEALRPDNEQVMV